MGQILIIEGADFSNNPNAINLNDLPVVTDQLKGFYTGKGSTLAEDNLILRMPPVFSEGSDFIRIPGQTTSPRYLTSGGSFFVGSIIQSAGAGLIDLDTVHQLGQGVSFTLFIRRAANSTSSSQAAIIAIRSISMIFYLRREAGTGHLQIGETAAGTKIDYDLGFHNKPAGVNAITFVLKRNTAKLYVDSSMIGQADIAGSNLPETAKETSFLSNFNGGSLPSGDQVKCLYVHSKELNLQEVQDIHASMSNVLQ